MSHYFCDGCTESIPAHKARIQCQECPNYDLCANCAILGTTTGAHLSSHRTVLHRASGFATVPPPPPPPSLPARYPSTGPARASSAVPGTAPSQQRGQSWSQFFIPNTCQHTDSFAQVTAAIFARVDTGRTGYMTPEAWSALCDVLGTPLHENICMSTWSPGGALPTYPVRANRACDAGKQTLQNGIGPNKESQADGALKRAYDLFSIDHIVRPRQTTTPIRNPAPQASLRNSFLNTLINAAAVAAQAAPSTPMPLLTLSGFTELYKITALTEPDTARNELNMVLRHYDLPLWRERGEIPRWALPPGPVPEMLNRVAQVRARAQASAEAENRLSAARVSMADAQIRRAEESQRRMGDIGTGWHTEYRYE